MLDFDKYPIFCQNRGRLRELSRDGSGAEDCYVTESGIEAVDFDGVKEHIQENSDCRMNRLLL